MPDPVKTEAPVEYRPPSQMKPEELEALAAKEGAEGGEKPPEPAKPAEVKPPEPAKPADPPKPDAPKSLLDLAKDKDAARKAEQAKLVEQAKPVLDIARDFDPRRLEAMVKAAKSGDMVGLLSAAGGTHQQYTQQLLGAAGAKQPEVKKPEEPAANPEVKSLQERLAALEAERQEQQIAQGRKEYLGKINSVIKDKPEYKALGVTEDAAERIERRLIGFWETNGRAWPEGVSPEDLITLAARDEEREVASELEKQEKRLAKFRGLTPASSSGAVSPQQKAPASPPSTGSESPRTLTNENTTAPAVTRVIPKSREAVLEAIIKGDDAALAELGD